MGPVKPGSAARVLVLDAGAILEGLNVDAASCWTVPSVLAEIRDKGATGRRRAWLEAAGLRTKSPSPASMGRVEAASRRAGNLGRLSPADREVLALALELDGTLLTGDHTVQDVAVRLGINVAPVSRKKIAGTKDWRARCSGCGRDVALARANEPCSICGARVRLVPKAPRSTH